MVSDALLDEIDRGEGLTLAQLAKRCPRTRQNRPVSIGCLVRWIADGARGPGAERVRLEAARIAGKWVSTPGALRRFIIAQTPDGEPAPAPRTATRRRRAADRAARELEAMGV